MQKQELYEEIDNSQSITEEYLGLSLKKFLFLLLIVLALGIYIGILFYGNNSLEVLFGLQDYENFLESEISRLKSENASLQKEYFELKEISAPVSVKAK
jgi:cell division protein FtsL